MANALPEYDRRCKNKIDLENFYDKWYTYISQIFGDEQVRDLIQKIYPNPELELKSKKNRSGPFAGTYHHIVSHKNKKMIICSLDQHIQNTDIHKGDVLCQSYALLNYFGIKMDKTDTDIGHWLNQMKMIEIYVKFLNNKIFMRELEKLITVTISIENPARWHLHIRDKETDFNFEFDDIVKNIKEVLELWGSYGYWTFIKNGSCMKEEYFDGLKLLYGNNQTLGSRKRSSSVLKSGTVLVPSTKRSRRLSPTTSSGGYKKKRKTFKKTSRKIQRKRKSSRQKRV